MKKIGLIVKEKSQELLKDSIKNSDSIFIIKYSKLSSPDLTNLRQSLKNSRASLFVVKNSVARRALKDANLESLISAVEGPCGIIFTKEEPVETSKVLYNFTKEHEHLKLEGGWLKDRVITKKDIESLAKLPSRQVLLTMLVNTLNSPIFGLVWTLKQPLVKLAVCLEQIKNKKDKSNEATT